MFTWKMKNSRALFQPLLLLADTFLSRASLRASVGVFVCLEIGGKRDRPPIQCVVGLWPCVAQHLSRWKPGIRRRVAK